jgi:hypothetical protein
MFQSPIPTTESFYGTDIVALIAKIQGYAKK